MEWMILPLKRYAQFSGRSRRMEYWMWVLFVVIATIVLSVLDSILGLGGRTQVGPGAVPGGYSYGAGVSGGWLANIFSLAVLIPGLAVSVRRLHDVNRSGWWLLVPLAPYAVGFAILFTLTAGGGGVSGLLVLSMLAMVAGLIGAIVLLVWFCMPGTVGTNDYGPDPLDDSNEDLTRTFE